ncbi:MAG TPA: cell wall hydrolase [Burkholderiales bacterium]|nr:cell wall hydrolase [Burkholderiales bacterium]
MPSARFRLRLFWYRLDKEACAVALVFGLIVGGFAYAVQAVVGEREAALARLHANHAQNIACLARNVYFEARGEPEAGQYAVAEVTMNRKASGRYPNTVCGVVYERQAFSWTAVDILPEPEGEAWSRAQEIAEEVYYGRHAPVLNGALFFHATYIKPDWATEKRRVARIGSHIFYR